MGDECCAVFWDGAKAISLFTGVDRKSCHAQEKKKKKDEPAIPVAFFFPCSLFFFFLILMHRV